MKTIKVVAIAFTLIASGTKLFAQTEQIKPEQTEAAKNSEQVAATDPVNDFLKNYVTYLENKKAKIKPVRVNAYKVPVSKQQVVAAGVSAQNSANLAASPPETPGQSQAQIEAPQLSMRYQNLTQDLQIYNAGPASPALTKNDPIFDQISMAKIALADKEALDKKNAKAAKTGEKQGN